MQLKTAPKTASRVAALSLLISFIGSGQVLAAVDAPSASEEVSWLTQLANDGNSGAALQLGLAYEHGRYGLQPNTQTAYHWLGLAAKNGNAYAADLVANHLAEQTPADLHQAVALWQQAAQDGNADAQVHLGEFFMQQGDEQAAVWLRKAAAQGDHRAQHDLVSLYRSNDLKEVDPHRDKNQLAVLVNEVDSTGMKLMLSLWHVIEASSTYEQSTEPLMERAQQGDPVAEYQLAMRYRDGAYDVNRDPEKSMSWLRRSAADGNRIAIQDLERVQE
jgi:hypothetical protein